jgi:hypothetical protein
MDPWAVALPFARRQEGEGAGQGEEEQGDLPPIARTGIASHSTTYSGVYRPLFSARFCAELSTPSRGTIFLGHYDDSQRFAHHPSSSPFVLHEEVHSFLLSAARAHDVCAIRIFGPESAQSLLNFSISSYGDLSEYARILLVSHMRFSPSLHSISLHLHVHRLMEIPEDDVVEMLKRESYGGADERRYSRCDQPALEHLKSSFYSLEILSHNS